MAKYSFDEYKQALEAGAYTPEAQNELLNKYPYLKYDKPTISAALNEGAYDAQASKTLFSEFPEFQPAGITDALKAAPELAYQGTKEGLLGTAAAIGENAPYKMENFGAIIPDEVKPQFQKLQEQTPLTPENIRAVQLPATQQRIQDIYAEKNIQPGTVGGVAADVFTSLGQMAPIVGLSMIAPEAAPAGLGFLATVSGGQKYGEARKAGYTEKEALLQGIGYGAAEFIGEKIGLDALVDGFKNVAKRPALINVAREMLKNAGVEAGEEGATQILQNAIDIAGKKYNPQPTNAAPGIFQSVPYAAMTGGITGGLMGGATSTLGSIVDRYKPEVKEQPKITPDIEKNNEVWTVVGQLNPDEVDKVIELSNAENAPDNQKVTTDYLTNQSDVEPEIQNNAPVEQQQAEVIPERTNVPPAEQSAAVKQETTLPSMLPLDEINQSPELQFKRNVDKNLVTDKLKGRKYNGLLAGVLDVFVNPEDGKTYVWNGNHRLINARDNGVPAVKVAYTDFANMDEARTAAVLKNLAENNGEPLDYRNFFRESGEQDFETLKKVMAEKGIDISKGMATKGFALSKLNDYLTSEYEKGILPENVAVEIGKNQLSEPDQNALYQHVKNKYLDNKIVPTNGQIKNLIEFAKSAPKVEGEADLFGNTDVINQMSIKSEIADYIGNLIKKDKNMLKKLSNEDLAAAANERNIGELKTDQAATEAQKAAMIEMYFKKRMFAAGDEISGILNTATQRVIDGESANKVKAETFVKIRKTLGSEEKNGIKTVNTKPAGIEQSVERGEPKPAERNAAAEGMAETSVSAQPERIKEPEKPVVKISDIKTIEELAHRQKDLADAKVTSIEGDKATVNFKGKEYTVTETPTGLKYDEYSTPEPKAKQDGLFEEDLTPQEKDQAATRATEDLFAVRKSSGTKAFYSPRAVGMAEEETKPQKIEPTPHQHAIAGKLNELNRVEIVRLFEGLVNSIPEVRKRLRKEALGLFRPNTGKIELDASRLKDADYQTITEVIAHEIGHAVDWKEGEANQTLARGNVLGRIGALARFMKKTLNLTPDGTPRYLTSKQRRQIYNDTRKRLADSASWAENDYSNAYFTEVYRDEVSKYIEDNNLILEEVARGEMVNLAQKFLGWSDETVKAAWDWFSDPAELYANTFGAFLTNPGLLFKEAPTVANMLYDYLKNKPATLKLYQYFQQKINSGDRYKDNLNYIKEKMMKADARQAEYLAKTTDKQSLKDDMLSNMVDRLTPLLKYATVANRDESSFKMLSAAQKLRSINDIVEAYLKGFLPEISKIIEDNNLDITDIGLKAYFTRVIEERSKQGVIDLTDEKLAERLNAELDTHYSAEQIAAMETIFDKLHQARRPMIQSLVDKGLFTEELAKKMLDNKSYFTFDITEHLEKALGPGNSVSQRIHKQIGTLKISANPFVSTILKDIALMRLDIEMDFTKQAVGFLEGKGVPITKAKKDMNGRPVQPPLKSGMGLIEILQNGKAEGYHIPADIAKAINDNTFDVGAGMQALAAINNISRGTFTAANPAFTFSNLFRDVTGTFIKVPHILMNFGAWSRRMGAALKNAISERTEDKNVINEMLGRGLLYGERSMNYQPDADLSTWDNLLRKYKIANYEDFDAKNAPRYLKIVNVLMAAGEFITSPVINLSNRIERATKIGTFEFLKEIKNKYNLSDAEINWIVSDLAGTPNGKRKGRWTPYTNNLFLFSNIWVQSYKSHMDAYKYGSAEYLAKLGMLSVIPTVLTFVMSKLDDDDGWWSKISEYYKSGFNIIPVWWFGGPRFDENGKPVFLTLPKEETQRAIGATLWKALNSFADGKIRQGLTQIFDTWSGDVPKMAPALTAAWSMKQYLSGQNPYDYFRGNEVIDPRTFAAKDFDTDKAFLMYLANLFGMNVFYKTDPSYKANVAEQPSALETIAKTPLYGANVVGRFLKVDDRGEQQQIRELMDDQKTTSEREKKVANGYIEKIMAGRVDEITQEEYAAADKHRDYVRNEIRRLRNTGDAYKIRSAPKSIRNQVREILR